VAVKLIKHVSYNFVGTAHESFFSKETRSLISCEINWLIQMVQAVFRGLISLTLCFEIQTLSNMTLWNESWLIVQKNSMRFSIWVLNTGGKQCCKNRGNFVNVIVSLDIPRDYAVVTIVLIQILNCNLCFHSFFSLLSHDLRNSESINDLRLPWRVSIHWESIMNP